MRVLSFLILGAICLCFASTASAQSTASADKENFQVLPSSIPAGAQNLTLRLSGSESDLFSASSKTAPTIVFGTGVQLVPGSFRILNAAEAELRVNVTENLVAGVPLTITFYAPDGTKALRQEKATLSIVGPMSNGATTNPVMVSVSKIALVRVNVAQAQEAGDVIISGKINGLVTLEAPTGTLFSVGTMPNLVVESGGVTTANPRMNTDRDAFSFSVVNTALGDMRVRIGNILYETGNFASLKGVEGVLSALLTNTQIGTEPLLVPNAHTALKSLEGNDVPQGNTPPTTETPDPETPDPNTNNSGTPTSNFRNNNRSSDLSNPVGANGVSSSESLGLGGGSSFPLVNGVPVPNVNPSLPGQNGSWVGRSSDSGGYSSNASPSASGAVTKSSGGAPGVKRDKPAITEGGIPAAYSDGSNIRREDQESESADGEKPGSTERAKSEVDSEVKSEESVGGDTPAREGIHGDRDASELPDYREAPGRELEQSRSLYFADKDGTRLSSVVLDRAIADEKATRVWIVLERADISAEVDRVEVRIRMGGERRTITLTETGADTGIFKSDAAGIELQTLHAQR